MKFTIKFFLVVCLFSSVAFADGEMSNGGKANCTSGCGFADGDMGNGGKSGDMTGGGLTADSQTQKDSILIFVREYLRSIFG